MEDFLKMISEIKMWTSIKGTTGLNKAEGFMCSEQSRYWCKDAHNNLQSEHNMSCDSWLHQLRPEIKAGPPRDQWADIRQPQHRPATRKQTSKTQAAGLYDLAGYTKFQAYKET